MSIRAGAAAIHGKAIDLFSGCGGLTLGLRQAGFDVLAAIEFNEKAQQTYRLNHPRVQMYGKDIRSVDPEKVLSDLGLSPGDLDLLAGCPPCQGFSRLRTKNKFSSVDDPRNNLILEFIRFVVVMKPRNLMLENVPSLRDDPRFETLVAKLEQCGYMCEVRIVDAADFGVPQRRRRLILLASLGKTPLFPGAVKKRKTVRAAFRVLKDDLGLDDALHAFPENRSEAVKEIIRMIPKDGGSRSQLPPHLVLSCHKRSNGFGDVYGRMAWDSVAPTITSGCHNPSKGRFLHPEKDRTITLREAALLQGFPRRYRFLVEHGKESIALMIGNALPPPLIAAHARGFIEG